MLRETLAEFNSLADPDDDDEQRKVDRRNRILSLWAKLQAEFDAAAANAREDADADDDDNSLLHRGSFALFALRRIHRNLLAFILDETLSDDLAKLAEHISSEVGYRMQANLGRYAISKSTFLFLFDITIAASRAVHDALKLLHERQPDLDIIAIVQAFEDTETTHTVRGKTTKTKPVDRFKQAVTTLDPTVWGKSAARTGANSRASSIAPADGNTANQQHHAKAVPEQQRTQAVDDQAANRRAKSPSPGAHANNGLEDDGDDMPPGGGDSDRDIDKIEFDDEDLGARPSSASPRATASRQKTHPALIKPDLSTIIEVSTMDAASDAFSNESTRHLQEPPANILGIQNVTIRKHRRSSADIPASNPALKRPRLDTSFDGDDSFKFTRHAPAPVSDYIPSPEQPRHVQPARSERLSDLSFDQSSGLFGSPRDLGLGGVSSGNSKNASYLSPLATTEASDSVASPALESPSIIQVEEDSIVTEAPLPEDVLSIESTAWLPSVKILNCLDMVAASCGDDSWLVVDSLVTGGNSQLDDSTFRRLSHSTINILPLFLGGDHWALATLRRCGPRVEADYYDSLKTPAHTREAERRLTEFCRSHLPDSKFLPGFMADMPCAQQENGHDCGVFVVAFVVHLAAQRTAPSVDPRLWRALISIMNDMWKKEAEELPPAEDRLRVLFRSQYVDHERLAVPRSSIPLLEQPPANASSSEASNFVDSVVAWRGRVEQDIARRSMKKIPAWTAAYQHLTRTSSVFDCLRTTSATTLRAAEDAAKQTRDEHNRYAHLSDRTPTNAAAPRESGQAGPRRGTNLQTLKSDMLRAEKQANRLRVYAGVWNFVTELLKEASATVEARLEKALAG